MIIKCKLSNIDKAIKALDAYEKSLDRKKQELLSRVADVGVAKAQTSFQSAQYDGDNNVTVEKSFDASSVYVVASGNAVAFIEFGTGAMYPDIHPNQSEGWMEHGSWSMSALGKGHWNSGYGWWYEIDDGLYKHTYGNPANMCLYWTAREMERKSYEIAKEVFGT